MKLNNIIYNESGKIDVKKMMVNGSLPTDAYKYYDDKMVGVAKQELNFIKDLNEYGLVDSSISLAKTIVSYDKVSSMSKAEVSMDGITRSQNGRLDFIESGVPVPIFRKDFELGTREDLASIKSKSIRIETATRVVAEEMNDACLNGYSRNVDGFQFYGLRNEPNRNTINATAQWESAGGDAVEDVRLMIKALHSNNYALTKDSCILYVASNLMSFIDKDYSAEKSGTYKQRFEAFAPIKKVEMGTGLPDGEVVLVQMRSDVIELKVAQDLTFFEQPSNDIMLSNFTVLSAMALIVKSDHSGNSGVCHLTGA